jgi:hypothetical protein
MTLVRSTTQLKTFFSPPFPIHKHLFYSHFGENSQQKKAVALWDKGQLSLPNIVSQVS